MYLFIARQLLHSHKRWRLKDFLTAFQDATQNINNCLKNDNDNGSIIVDGNTSITGVPRKNDNDQSKQYIVELLQKKGVCITEVVLPDTNIVYIDRDQLPLDPRKRLQSLFTMKKKWTLEEIKPFLTDIVTPGNSEEQILVKHARSSTVMEGENKGQRVYSMR
eukprot:GEZU01016290.1.p1 GENE.GEZU01016290.1~~GEZU01016290.1.p1  ORF type:complete len:163 (-),score=40.07 GEZU01016290.1:49-537(-)